MMQELIAILIAMQTGILGITATMLFKRLDSMEASITRAHKRIDTHHENATIHCSPDKARQHGIA